jgi:hypothetical protein
MEVGDELEPSGAVNEERLDASEVSSGSLDDFLCFPNSTMVRLRIKHKICGLTQRLKSFKHVEICGMSYLVGALASHQRLLLF